MSGHVLHLSLPDDLAAAVERDEYASEGEAVLGAVEEWRAQRQAETIDVEELKRLVQEGADSGSGRFETFEEIRAEARLRFLGA